MKTNNLGRVIRMKMLLFACGLFFFGCAPKLQVVLLEDLEESPNQLEEQEAWVALLPGCEIRLAARDTLSQPVLATISADSVRNDHEVYIVSASKESSSLIACSYDLDFRSSGGYMTPGFTTADGSYIPGFYVSGSSSIEWKHSTSRAVPVDQVRDMGEYVVCHLADHNNGSLDVYVRKPGLERLLQEPSKSIHPGYAVMGGDSWFVLDKSWIEHFLTGTKSDPEMVDQEPSSSPDDSTFVKKSPLTCENIERRIEAADEEHRTIYAVKWAACLSSAGEDDRALKVLQSAIKEFEEDDFGNHNMLRWYYLQLLFTLVATGDLQEAIPVGAAYLHSSPAHVEFPEEFTYKSKSESEPMTRFLQTRRTDLDQHWPRFRESFFEALKQARQQEPSVN